MAKRKHRDDAPAKGLDGESQNSDTSSGTEGKVTLQLYQEKPGHVPLLDFLGGLKHHERLAVVAAVEVLNELGHRLRPPHNEHLGDRLFYLRVRGRDGTYRVFYWPHGRGIVILGHGFSKKSRKCPPGELKRALEMREKFRTDPSAHTFEGEIHGEEAEDN